MIKQRYVLSQPQTRAHRCHWPGCERQVPPAMWGCKTHWMTLPQMLRDRIWASFRPGQEKDWSPGAAYVEAAEAVQTWIRNYLDTAEDLPPKGGVPGSPPNE